MRISGVLPLRCGVQLGYPFELAIRSLRPLCDEVVVLVDPESNDGTIERVAALGPDVLLESRWNLDNHDGLSDEIALQTARAIEAASGDWVLSLQADEVLHEREAAQTRLDVAWAEREGVTALKMVRWYFFGSLERYRSNWTVPLPRLVKRGAWRPDPASGAMYFVPCGEQRAADTAGAIYHYSRIGDPLAIAKRVRNLDTFYHAPERLLSPDEVPPYTFELRKLDTYVRGHQAEPDGEAELLPFPLERHPAAALEHFGATP